MTDPDDIPTEPGIYEDAHGNRWILLPENSPAGFYSCDLIDGEALVVQPYLAGLDMLRGRRPYRKIN